MALCVKIDDLAILFPDILKKSGPSCNLFSPLSSFYKTTYMKKVFIFTIITLGMLTIIALEGRSLHDQQLRDHCYDRKILPVFLLNFGYEWTKPIGHDHSHQLEI